MSAEYAPVGLGWIAPLFDDLSERDQRIGDCLVCGHAAYRLVRVVVADFVGAGVAVPVCPLHLDGASWGLGAELAIHDRLIWATGDYGADTEALPD